jgi:2-polyprenyl-6-methoxyphenol hydroxylase-like FAD-dependent oxidoreductase
MRILISGCGIAGPTLAYWLLRDGHDVSIVEHAPALRRGGYIIDFWGRGYDIAEKMGILPELRRNGYFVEEVRFVDGAGKRVGGFPVEVFARATHDRYVSLRRSDLAEALYRTVEGRAETRFGDSLVELSEEPDRVVATFRGGMVRDFDLVVGAGGLHSPVRDLVFGPQATFERYLGYKVAAFEIEGYRPRDELVYMMHTEVGRQVARFSMRDDRTTILFVYADADGRIPHDMDGRKEALHRAFADSGWETPVILDALDKADDLYFDRVSQIEMDRWTSGRCALVGDAAACPSLLAGQGSALAMIDAYVLAGEIARAGADYEAAFAAYERLVRPFITEKQKAARAFAGSFAPKSALSLFLRNVVSRFLGLPFVADLTVGRTLRDDIALPDYAAAVPSPVPR